MIKNFVRGKDDNRIGGLTDKLTSNKGNFIGVSLFSNRKLHSESEFLVACLIYQGRGFINFI